MTDSQTDEIIGGKLEVLESLAKNARTTNNGFDAASKRLTTHHLRDPQRAAQEEPGDAATIAAATIEWWTRVMIGRWQR